MNPWDQVRLVSGIIGTLITYHDNGSLQVRINRGQQWAWQIISVSEEDAEILPPYEEEAEDPIIDNQPATMPSKNTLYVAMTIIIIILAVIFSNGIKQPVWELAAMTMQINQMNTDDIQDIGSCKSLKDRQKEKKILLEKIQKMY